MTRLLQSSGVPSTGIQSLTKERTTNPSDAVSGLKEREVSWTRIFFGSLPDPA